MRVMALVLLSLLTAMPSAQAKKRTKGRTPSRQELNFFNRLLHKCNNGEGQSCFDYAVSLSDLNDPKYSKKISIYMRRACTLAYQPACNRKDKPANARVITSTPDADGANQRPTCGADTLKASSLSPVNLPGGRYGQQITRISKDSLFEKAGLRVGDVVTKVNGSIFTQSTQMSKALDEGGAMVEVTRGATVIPLALSCPRN